MPRIDAAAPAATDGAAPVEMSVEDFVLAAIPALRDVTKGNGLHVVFSGFNDAFRATFPGVDPREVTARMAAEGKITLRPAFRGAVIYLPGDKPASADTSAKANAALAKMGLKPAK